MTDQNNEDRGIELDKLDLSSFKRPSEKEVGGKGGGEDISPPCGPVGESGGRHDSAKADVGGRGVQGATAGGSRFFYIALVVGLVLVIGVVVMRQAGVDLPLIEKKVTITNASLLEVKTRSDTFNKFMVNLNRPSGRSVDKGLVDINLENVENALVILSEYNLAVSGFLRDREALNGLRRVGDLYRSPFHAAYIRKLEGCLKRYRRLLTYRLTYHEEIMGGKQVKRMTYEKFILDYKMAVKQMKTKYVNLDVSLKKARAGGAAGVIDLYFIPDCSVFDVAVRLIE